MALTLKSTVVPLTWVDLTLVTGLSSIAGATCMIQNQGDAKVSIAFTSSATQPAADDASFVLGRNETISGTASHVWAKASTIAATVAVGLTD